MESGQFLPDETDVPVKRPPDDDEPIDEDESRPTPKRRATLIDTPTTMPQNHPKGPNVVTAAESSDPQLVGKTTGELVGIILAMRSAHERQNAELRNRQSALSRQLEQLTSILNAHFASQVTVFQSLQQTVASVVASGPPVNFPSAAPTAPADRNGITDLLSSHSTPMPALRQTPVSPYPRSAPATSVAIASSTQNTTTSRFQPTTLATFSPSQAPAPSAAESLGKRELKITPSEDPTQPPLVEISRLDTAAEAWEEFRYGRNGNSSLETLDAVWGPRWRQDFKLREFYKRRKAIADKIKQYMADGIDEQSAIEALDSQRGKRKLNWLALRMLDERKAQKEQYKEARKAAIANKVALDSMTGVSAADSPSSTRRMHRTR